MARFESEMLSFGYTATLHVRHPTTSLQNLSARLSLPARQSHNANDQRTTSNGRQLNGTYTDYSWYGDLRTVDQEDITEFLRRIVVEFEPHREFLCEIAETGGEVCVFIGVGSSRCCAHQFDRRLLSELVATGLDLRIDFYGCDLPQRGLHSTEEFTA